MLGLRRLVPRALWVARGCGWALPPPPPKKMMLIIIKCNEIK